MITDYLDSNSTTAVIILENTDAVPAGGSAKAIGYMEVMDAELAARSFEAQHFVLSPHVFGVPQNAPRLYVVYIKSGHATPAIDYGRRPVTSMMETLRALVTTCVRKPPPARLFLGLVHREEDMERELQARLGRSKDEDARSRSWVLQHKQIYTRHRLLWGQEHCSNRSESSSWHGTLTSKQKDALIITHKLLAAEPLMVDLESPNLMAPRVSETNTATGQTGCELAPTMVQKQVIWLHLPLGAGLGEERVLLASEALSLCGFPVALVDDKLRSASEGTIEEATARCPAVPVYLALVTSCLAAISWRQATGDDTPLSSCADVEDVLGFINKLESPTKKRAATGQSW